MRVQSCAAAIAGAASAGLLVSAQARLDAVTSAGGAAAIASLASKRLPAVLHVAAQSVVAEGPDSGAAALSVSNDIEGAYAAVGAAAGAVLLASGSPQEAHDLTVAAHAVAVGLSAPVLHVFDGVGVGDASGKVRLLRYHELQAAIDGTALRALRAGQAPNAPRPTAGSVQATLTSLGPLLGKEYSAFSYSGPQAPAAVVVAHGANAATLAAVAGVVGGAASRSIGVLTARVLRPWSSDALLAALPTTSALRAVATVAPHATGASTLHADVAAAVAHGHVQAPVTDLRVGGNGLLDASQAAALLRGLADGYDVKTTGPVAAPAAQAAPTTALAGSAASAGGASAIVYGLSHDGGSAAGAGALSVLAQTWPGDVRGRTVAGIGAGGLGVTSTEIAIVHPSMPAHAASAAVLPATDVIFVSHPSILRSVDALGRLKHGGTVVINLPTPKAAAPAASSGSESPVSADSSTMSSPALAAVEDVLSASDRQLLASRKAVLVTLCASEVVAAAVSGLGAPAASTAVSASGVLAPGGTAEAIVLHTAIALALSSTGQRVGGGAALASALSFSAAAPWMETAHRGALPAPAVAAGLLHRLYSRTRTALTRVAIPNAWAGAGGKGLAAVAGADEAARPLYAVDTLAVAGGAGVTLSVPPAPPCVGPPTTLGPAAASAAAAAKAASLAAARADADNGSFLRAQARRTALVLAYQDAFGTVTVARPSEEGAIFTGTVSVNRRLTPVTYDRNIFHVEIDITGTGMSYDIGSALGVYGENDRAEVDELLGWYGVAPDAAVAFTAPDGRTALTSARTLLTSELDVFGKPTKDFYEALAAFATDPDEAAALRHLGSDGGGDAFKARSDEAATYADILREFPSARPPIAALAGGLVPRIKPRHYSIASSMKVHPTSVHLLVVEVEWKTPGGKTRFGQCSRFLANAAPGSRLAISVLPSEMHLPPSPASPVIMAGLGTGMAPFRAFLQERFHLAASGAPVGPMTLYFGSRFRAQEYLYGDELEAWAAARPDLLRLRLAFSRDSEKKVYIQHLMAEDGSHLWRDVETAQPGGSFYLCGPTWPEPDVEAAVVGAMVAHGGLQEAAAKARITQLKAARRYVLEVY